jgi:lysophospholipase L1-like esterase
MHVRLVRFTVSLLLLASGVAYAAGEPPYYVALGDSLALGVQPTSNGTDVPTNQRYVDDLYGLARLRVRDLRLAKLGCSGETTTTMINGGICDYPQGSQLAQAVAFLQTHRVAFITVDIGANNVDGCYTLNPPGIDPICFSHGVDAVTPDLPYILATLQSWAGPDVPIFGMNYYDPFLAAWLLLPGPIGQDFATTSEVLTVNFNTLLATVYQAFGVPIADVAEAYHITDFTVVPVVDVPLNVLLTLTWTWMGAAPPVGPNIHPNAVGYAVIAGAFVRAFEAP